MGPNGVSLHFCVTKKLYSHLHSANMMNEKSTMMMPEPKAGSSGILVHLSCQTSKGHAIFYCRRVYSCGQYLLHGINRPDQIADGLGRVLTFKFSTMELDKEKKDRGIVEGRQKKVASTTRSIPTEVLSPF